MTFQPKNGVEWEPVVVPLAEGIDINTRARLVAPTKLLKAENAYFPRVGGPEKRKGHTQYDVKDIGNPSYHTTDKNLYGYGLFTEGERGAFTGLPSEGSRYPDAGSILGVAKRDNEELVWDGWRLYRRTDSGTSRQERNHTNYHGLVEQATAYLPSAHSVPFAKTQNSQAYVDCADNGVIRVVAFRDLSDGLVYIKCYDSATGSLKFSATANNVVDPKYLRVISCGDFVHVFVSDLSSNKIWRDTIHQDDSYFMSPGYPVAALTGMHFDVCKSNEDKFLMCYLTSTGGIKSAYFNPNGTFNDELSHAGYSLNIDEYTALSVGVDIHPQTLEFCVIWKTAAEQHARIYNANSTTAYGIATVSNNPNCIKVAVVASYMYTQGIHGGGEFGSGTRVDAGVFYLYTDNVYTTPTTYSYIRLRTLYGNVIQDYNLRYNVNLVGKPFRVGNVPFVVACYPSTLQTTYLLLDNHLTPCGKFEYGSAVNNTADPWMFSVNYVVATNKWETYNFHCALMYKQRVLDQDGVFHEISSKFLEMDFLPEFRRKQAGRCLYFPGAQMSSYDGERLYEDTFHVTPELSADNMVPGSGSGSLTNSGEYYYRVYPCHKNAQGEEVRGPAILSPVCTLGASDTNVTITGKTIPTCREGTYFLVYRNAHTGTLWYLVSSRDPSNPDCPKNNVVSATWTFVDTLSDAELLSRELDPANTAGYKHSYSAPACEVIGFGKGRLWVAGGELPSGTILPSRIFLENEVPSFNLNYALSIDRADDPITAIGFVSDYLLAFKRKTGYIVQGEAADNLGIGDTLGAQLVLADSGCISHNSLVRISAGVCFQSEGGIRLVDAAGNIRPIGTVVDPLTTYVVDSVLDTGDRLIKFYQAERTLVFDYEGGQWTTWTIGTTSAQDGLVAHNDKLWKEDDVYTDAGGAYTYKIRTANIGPELLGVHRFRRVAGIGESNDNYTITCRAYYDDNPDFTEEWEWDSSTDLNTSLWGGGTWGSGFWGDASGTLLYARDSLWRWRHRLSRQKASCISIEIEYTGTGKGPVHTALGFEVGRKSGFDRQAKGS